MTSRRRLLLAAGLAVLVAGGSFLAGTVTGCRPLRAMWIRLTARTPAVRLNRLGRLVEQGMTPRQVRGLLGEPTRITERPQGVRWSYWDGVSCAGFDLIVEFRNGGAAGPLREGKVCYVHQCADLHFFSPHTNPRYFTIGVPLKR